MCTYLCCPPIAFSLVGSSRSVPQKRTNTQETSDDEAAGNTRPVRKCTIKKKASAVKNPAQPAPQKRKEPRVNYKTLGAAEYMIFRRSNCYSHPRSADVTDNRFWVPEQAFVLSDVYRSYRHPIRVMNPLKLSVLKDKESFALAASVVERMQLDDLMEIRCPYNVDLVLQFMSTVYISNDIAKTMTWMSGTTRVESTFDSFADRKSVV